MSLGAVLNPSADYLRTVAKSCDGQRSVVAAAWEPTWYVESTVADRMILHGADTA